ncbi:succinylglutamate desuccinylase/aspartoacylase domain-containing protein [Hugenholtzia roseola]|uniref:succinylglutamate desuccinylase/aspartoacylase domain-containing protein n=1 Tax=Hugenholtzia roseola TaxID=1002 RepID=UPI0003FD1DB5|nr:succinylglutamate desuccinylase/aspartoacylase family protein [Hugenholtzia roseola]
MEYKRIIADINAASRNPDQEVELILLGSLHGNEKAGYLGLESVVSTIQRLKIPLKGHLLALAGNLEALRLGKRYLRQDLNRLWQPQYLENIDTYTEQDGDLFQLKEIYQTLQKYTQANRYRRRVFIDLHTTSAPDGIFAISTPTSDLALLKKLDVPIIHGLTRGLAGTSMGFMSEQGYETFAFEAGQTGSEQAIYDIAAGIWRILAALGMVESHLIPKEVEEKAQLKSYLERKKLAQELDFFMVHRVEQGDDFCMRAGFVNFQFVEKGELLAQDKRGEIRAPLDAYLLMPLYQKEGQDGFFLVVPKYAPAILD